MSENVTYSSQNCNNSITTLKTECIILEKSNPNTILTFSPSVNKFTI